MNACLPTIWLSASVSQMVPRPKGKFLGDLQAQLGSNAAEAPKHTTVVPTYPLLPANNPQPVNFTPTTSRKFRKVPSPSNFPRSCKRSLVRLRSDPKRF